MSGVKFNNLSVDAPTPAAGKFTLYSKTDKRIYTIDESGAVLKLIAATSTDTVLNKILDSSNALGDATDTTKQITWALSGATAGATLTIASSQAASHTLTIPPIRQAETVAIRPQYNFDTPANPTGTTSTTGLMMGLSNGSTFITPQVTGRVLMLISGQLTNTTATAGDGASAQLHWNTGNGPANAAALTGNAVGGKVQAENERAAQDFVPFTCLAVVTGLTLGTAVWVDLGVAAVTGGTGAVQSLMRFAMEI